MPAPSNPPSMKPLLAWEPSQERQRRENPLRASRQSRDVMVSENIVTRRKTFVDPPRE